MKKYILYIVAILAGVLVSTPVFAETMKNKVDIKPSMTLDIPVSSINLNLDPATNAFASEDVNITVGTNNKTGYWITMSSATSGSDLVNIDDNTKTIPTIATAGSYTSSDFPINQWGYKIDSGNYTPFVSGATIKSSNTTANGETFKLNIASKIDYLQPSGTYNIALNIKMLPNMIQEYMQDITPEMCTEDPSVVMDKRDGQTYTIARLKDGKCWMTQDLTFGYDSSNPSTTTITIAPEDTNTDIAKTMAVYDLVINGETECQDNGYSVPCAHYGINSSGKKTAWYNFAMMTGYTVSDDIPGSTGKDAEYDICPKGWRLPTLNEGEALAASGDRDNFEPTYNGGYWYGQLHSNGTWSYYETSTIYNDKQQNVIFVFSDGRFGAGYVNVNRHDGLSTRCLLKES